MRAHSWTENLRLARAVPSGNQRRQQQRIREELDSDVEKFLAAGGRITQVPVGVSGEKHTLLRKGLRKGIRK